MEFLAVLGRFDRVNAGAHNWHAVVGQCASQIQWSLSTELNDHTIWLHSVADVQNVFYRQRFEKQQVTGVVIGADRFRVRIDHDRFVTQFLHREGCMTTAVIEFDTLANSVGSATQNHDAFFIRLGGCLVFVFVGGIVIRRVGFEFGGTGVD